MKLNVVLFLAVVSVAIGTGAKAKKHIVHIMSDDMGRYDVSFTGGNNQIITPNIDMLAYSGVALNRYYSHSLCTPTRSALLTGLWAHKSGMQGRPLTLTEDRGIPVNTTLWSQRMQEAGYKTYLVGKWHVGASRSAFLPTNRGFEYYFGHTSGMMDYYEYTSEEPVNDILQSGLVLYNGTDPAWDTEGYLTDIYTEKAKSVIENHDTSSPMFLFVHHAAVHAATTYTNLQAPRESVLANSHVELTRRRTYAGMVHTLDQSIGEVFEALYKKGILNDTIIFFSSDNGAMTFGGAQNYGCNWPCRGMKTTPWEGGVRVPAWVWSMNLTNTNHQWDGYMHVVDVMPTLMGAAGVTPPSGIDGINLWDSIIANGESERTTMYEINDYNHFGTIIYGDYKLHTGNLSVAHGKHLCSDLLGIIEERMPSYTALLENSTVYSILNEIGMNYNTSIRSTMNITCEHNKNLCTPNATSGTVCLYNIIDDPCENNDLSESYPDLVTTMKELLANATAERIPRIVPYPVDPLCAPYLHNYTWGTPWITS